jgi:hypothetical protein
MDPIIKRVLVDPVTPGATRGMQLAGAALFATFLGMIVWTKEVPHKEIEQQVYKEYLVNKH